MANKYMPRANLLYVIVTWGLCLVLGFLTAVLVFRPWNSSTASPTSNLDSQKQQVQADFTDYHQILSPDQIEISSVDAGWVWLSVNPSCKLRVPIIHRNREDDPSRQVWATGMWVEVGGKRIADTMDPQTAIAEFGSGAADRCQRGK